MQKTAFLFFLLFQCAAAAAQFIYHPLPQQKKDFTAIALRGYTKCLVYKVEEGKQQLATEATYGAGGLLVSVDEKGTNENGDSITVSAKTFSYDSKGRLAKTVDNDEETGESISTYLYDAAGRLSKKKIITIDPPTYSYTYDAKGKLVEMLIVQRMPVVDENGEATGKAADMPAYKSRFSYNGKGQLVEEKVYHLRSGEPEVQFRFGWAYDPSGRVSSLKRMNGDGSVRSETTFAYDKDGFIIKSTEKTDEGTIESVYVWKLSGE